MQSDTLGSGCSSLPFLRCIISLQLGRRRRDGPACKGLDVAPAPRHPSAARGRFATAASAPQPRAPASRSDRRAPRRSTAATARCAGGVCVTPDPVQQGRRLVHGSGRLLHRSVRRRRCAWIPSGCVDPGLALHREPASCCTGACTNGKCGDSPNPSCFDKGATCSSDEQCCSLDCASGKCTSGAFCTAPGNSCDADGECCSLNCIGESSTTHGTCDGNACVPAGSPAADASQCCSKILSGGVCQKLGSEGTNYACSTLGESCGSGYECCSRNCQGGTCIPAYTCNAPGDICTRTEDCCSGMCSPGASAADPGRCLAPSGGCTQDGVPCDGPSNCCTRRCVDLGSGTTVCQPAGGCRMTGDFCDSTDACCGGTNEADPGTQPSTYGVFCDGPGPDRRLGRTPRRVRHELQERSHLHERHELQPAGQHLRRVRRERLPELLRPGRLQRQRQDRLQAGLERHPALLRLSARRRHGTPCPDGYDGSNPLCCIAQGAVCQFRDQCCGGTPCVPDAEGVLRCAKPTTSCDPRGTRLQPVQLELLRGHDLPGRRRISAYLCTDGQGNNGQCVIAGGGCDEQRPVLLRRHLQSGRLPVGRHMPARRRILHRRRRLLQRPRVRHRPRSDERLCKAPVSGPTCSQSGQACAAGLRLLQRAGRGLRGGRLRSARAAVRRPRGRLHGDRVLHGAHVQRHV